MRDFQFQIALDAGRTFAKDATVDERLVFLRKTYILTLLGLGVAGLGGWAGATTLLPLLIGGGILRLILVLAVLMGACYVAQSLRRTPGVNYLAFFGLTFVVGITAGPLLFVATRIANGEPTIILQAVVITGAAITGLSGYVLVTRKDFDFLRGALSIGLFAILGLIVVGIFVGSLGFHLLISGAGALLFAGFVLYDTSVIVRKHPADDHVGAAISLFIDFFMLFVYILRLLTLLSGSRD